MKNPERLWGSFSALAILAGALEIMDARGATRSDLWLDFAAMFVIGAVFIGVPLVVQQARGKRVFTTESSKSDGANLWIGVGIVASGIGSVLIRALDPSAQVSVLLFGAGAGWLLSLAIVHGREARWATRSSRGTSDP